MKKSQDFNYCKEFQMLYVNHSVCYNSRNIFFFWCNALNIPNLTLLHVDEGKTLEVFGSNNE